MCSKKQKVLSYLGTPNASLTSMLIITFSSLKLRMGSNLHNKIGSHEGKVTTVEINFEKVSDFTGGTQFLPAAVWIRPSLLKLAKMSLPR